jgi:hypothetical protein
MRLIIQRVWVRASLVTLSYFSTIFFNFWLFITVFISVLICCANMFSQIVWKYWAKLFPAAVYELYIYRNLSLWFDGPSLLFVWRAWWWWLQMSRFITVHKVIFHTSFFPLVHGLFFLRVCNDEDGTCYRSRCVTQSQTTPSTFYQCCTTTLKMGIHER